jgi:environmental stress-induced protein Ves
MTADGPFSRFAGVTRWFAVLSGAGVALQPARWPQPDA